MSHGLSTILLPIALLGALAEGCAPPKDVAIRRHPPGTLKVAFEPTSSDTSCLVAGAVMAANYVEPRLGLKEPQVRRQLASIGKDESRVADVRQFLRDRGLEVICLQGQRSLQPPTGLGYWLRRGYPPICIINRIGEIADYNHAVVVIGFDPADADPARDETIIYFLDPSSPRHLESGSADQFDQWWAAAERALLIVTRAPE